MGVWFLSITRLGLWDQVKYADSLGTRIRAWAKTRTIGLRLGLGLRLYSRLGLIFRVCILYLISTVQLGQLGVSVMYRVQMETPLTQGFVLLATMGHIPEDACIIMVNEVI